MDKESITSRLTKLSQVVNGRIVTKEGIGINGLVDSLMVLHKECSMNSTNTDNQFVKDFVRKFDPIVKELSLLRTARRDYDLKSVIGRGHFGEVRVAVERSSGSVYAMKIIKKDSLLNQLHVSSYEEERDIMSTSSSVWIVQLHHSFQDDEHLFLVMDFHSGGDLHSLINRHDGILEESMARFYLAEMSVAINSLHLMGYVHRDIKPENILIDRTGHVKLADFGSSCSMENDATSHRREMFVPVGTPDYVCPELLTLAGADRSQLEGSDDVSRGEECDWWSLGVCAYEILCGRLPFSGLSESNSKLALYSSIMNHKASLKFPEDPSTNLSEAAKSLIEGLLEERSSRLKYQQVRGHKFFECIDFDGIRQAPPPYLPSIQSEDDTSNFSEPPQASKNPKTVHFFDDTFKTRDAKVNQGLSGRDLPFVGFTFDRVLSALGMDIRSLASPSRPENSRSSSRRSLLGDGVIERNNSSFLDNRLLVREARDWSVRLREAELKFQVLEKNLESTKKMREESERRMERAEEERNEAERQLFVQRNANASLKRTLEAELEKFSNVEEQTKQRTSTMVENLKEEFHQREKKFREELEGHRLMMSQLEEELAMKDQQLTRAEKELKDWKVAGSLNSGNRKDNKEKMIPVQQLEDVKMRLKIELKQAYLTKMKSAFEKMKSVERDHRKKEESLRNKLDEASKAQLAMEKKLSDSENERMFLEKELKLVKEKIQDYEGLEERSKALESEVKNLREVKKRERELTIELDNRNLRCQTLELTTKHLEDEMERLKRENEDMVNQSLLSLSENEDRMKIIQQQEAIIEMLKTNISAMEHQIRSLKCDLTEAKSLSREAIRLRKSRSMGHRLEMTFLGGVDYVGDKEDDEDDDVKNKNCDGCVRSDDDDDDNLPCEEVSSPIKNGNEVISSGEDDKENKPIHECLADDDDGDDDDEDEGDQVQNLLETESGPSKSKKYVSCHMAEVNGKKFPLDDKFTNFDVSIQSKRKKIRSSGSRGRKSADEPIASSKTTLEVKTKDSSVLAEISLQLGNKEKHVRSKREDFGRVEGRGMSLSKMNSCGRASVPESPHKSRGTKSWPHSGGLEASPPTICSEFTPYSPKSTTITNEDDGNDTSPETPKQFTQEGVDVATSPLSRRSLESSDLSSDGGRLVMTLTTRLCQSSGVKDIFNDTLDSIVEANSDVSRSGDAMAMGLARSSSQLRSSKKDKPSKTVTALPEMVSHGQNVGSDRWGVLFEKDPINCEADFCHGLVERLKEFEEDLRREFEETAVKSSEDKRRESTVKSLEHEIERLKVDMERLENEREQQKEEMMKRRESVGVKMERSLAAKDDEIAKLKESVHEQRIRVLDIKYELREKISTYEKEISELKCKLLQSEIVSADLERVQRARKEEEEELRSKVEAKEKLIEEAELKLNDARKQLEDVKSVNAHVVASLKEKIEEMDKQLAEERSSNQNLKKEVEKGSERLSSLEASNEDLKKQTKQLSDERGELTSSVSRMQMELDGTKRENQSLARQNEQLMNTCLELESQAVEMEALLKKREELKEVERLKQTANDGQVANMNSEISRLKQELADAKEKCKQLLEKNGVLNKQLMQAESKQSQQINLRKKEDSSSSLLRMIKDESDSRSAMMTEENNQLKGELVAYKKEADDLKKEVKQLKTLTKELEEQMEMMEAIDSKTKRRISDMLQEEDAKRKEFTKKEARVAELAHQFRMESQARKSSESKVEELTRKLESTNQERRLEVERLNKQVNVQMEKILELNNQLSTTEERCSTFELEVRNLRRCLETRDEELNMLKEEISKEITRLQMIKSTNVTLGEELEARKKNERMLSDRRVELENILQSLQASYQEDKFRMEETISQQGKLIDFLQAKVESQPQKKKLFGSKRTEPTPYPVVNDWKGEAQKRNSKNYDVENIIGLSQKYRTLPPKSALPPQHSGVALRQRPVSTAIAANPTNQSQEDKGRRSLANPNHNFKTSIFCRPTKCIVCLGTIYFIQQSAKCLDCGAMCHPKCLPHLPFNCGMESEYSIYSAEVDRISRNSFPRTSSAARSHDNQPVLLTGVVKVNGSIQMANSKQKNPPWQKMSVTIKGTRLELSDSSGKEKLEAVFELCPSESEGEVVVESSLVSQETVPSYSSSSLLNPLLLLEPNELMLVIVVRIERPYSATRDGRIQPRVLYLLPSDFKEKQHLVAALETVVNSNQNSKHKIRDVKVLGNLLLRLDTKRTEGRSQKMEINCTWPYNGEVILLGTSLGLFAMVLNNTPEDRPMVKLEGLPTIHSMEILPEHQMLFAIAGPDRDLVLVDLPTLQNFLIQSQAFTSGSGPRPQPISFKGLSKATGCTVFAAKKTGGNIYLGVATLMQKILMFKYNYSSREFVLKKEYDTSQLCSCLEFGSERVVVGAGKFYHINLETFNLADFMSPADPTLSFVANSAAKYGSQPIEVLAINEPNQPEEFLLCYYEFGVFVDGQGFRSRDENMNWSGLPLAFAFRKPFLYMVHYNSIQLVEIPPKNQPPRAPLRASINLPGACYLGPAVTSGAVYLGSCMDGVSEVVCLRGNKIPEAEKLYPSLCD